MKIYFVHSLHYEDILRTENVKIIISYARRHIREGLNPDIPEGFSEIMVDSGGFQLQKGTGDRSVYLKAYSLWMELLLRQHPEIVAYMNLDIWRNGEETLSNQLYLESEGLNPIPIWHAGTDIHFLDYYYNNYEYIAIGGIASLHGRDKIQKIVEWLYQTFPGRKYHFLGIGLSGIRAFGHFKPYSVDFSTWNVPARYGHDIVDDRKQIIKEVRLSAELRQQLRDDKTFEKGLLVETVKKIKELESKIESLNEPYQGALL